MPGVKQAAEDGLNDLRKELGINDDNDWKTFRGFFTKEGKLDDPYLGQIIIGLLKGREITPKFSLDTIIQPKPSSSSPIQGITGNDSPLGITLSACRAASGEGLSAWSSKIIVGILQETGTKFSLEDVKHLQPEDVELLRSFDLIEK